MKQITSKENAIFKDALKLTRKKYRDMSGRFLLEGLKPLEDALQLGIEIERVFIDSELADGICASEPWIAKADQAACLLDRKLFRELSDTETSQGVISIAAQPTLRQEDLDEVFSNGNVVVLDRLQDPGNIGTIVRTAEAAGYRAVVTIKGSADLYSPKVVRAAAGSLLRMPVLALGSAEQAVEILHGYGKRITVSCLEDAANCFETDLTNHIALVIGNEGRGVGRTFMESADIRVMIPMEGHIESLNAAVAAGILMYQAVGGKI
ncbi:MAG: RNA methyltransferase [Bacillota bacterium]|nr:RNA methyltransferase [Bacillota bacterium]